MSNGSTNDPPRIGAYGFRLTVDRGDELAGLRPLLVNDVPDSWVDIAFNWRVDPNHPPSPRARLDLGPDRVEVAFDSGDVLTICRDPLTATLDARTRSPDAVAHPHLAWVSATLGRWDHRPVIHGGVVLVDGRAWALVAEKGGGKSTSLASLHREGYEVLADDQVVVIGERVMAGPRTLDLRPTAPEELRAGARPIDRGEERWRLALPPCPATAPLAGILLLTEPAGNGHAVNGHADNNHRDHSRPDAAHARPRPVPPRDRLARLAPNLVLPRDVAMPDLVPLAAFPMWDWTRPREPAYLALLPDVLGALSLSR